LRGCARGRMCCGIFVEQRWLCPVLLQRRAGGCAADGWQRAHRQGRHGRQQPMYEPRKAHARTCWCG
jgi:hypothetical protein